MPARRSVGHENSALLIQPRLKKDINSCVACLLVHGISKINTLGKIHSNGYDYLSSASIKTSEFIR
jgi:hypothetical protein